MDELAMDELTCKICGSHADGVLSKCNCEDVIFWSCSVIICNLCLPNHCSNFQTSKEVG